MGLGGGGMAEGELGRSLPRVPTLVLDELRIRASASGLPCSRKRRAVASRAIVSGGTASDHSWKVLAGSANSSRTTAAAAASPGKR